MRADTLRCKEWKQEAVLRILETSMSTDGDGPLHQTTAKYRVITAAFGKIDGLRYRET